MTLDRASGDQAARGRPRLRRWLPLVLVAAVASGCTGEGSGDGKPDEPATALEVRVVTCAGRLAEDARAEIESGIGDTLSAYVVGGFLGDYPREDFVRAFEGFTSGAARDATEDIDLLTAARFAKANSVTATRLRARISCLVDRGDLVGASARVVFDFEAREPGAEVAEPFSLRGRLLLTPASGTWSVFGYDVSRDDVPASRASS